jgi:hypothetical protein
MKSLIAKALLGFVVVAGFAGCAAMTSTSTSDAAWFEKQRSQTDGSYR